MNATVAALVDSFTTGRLSRRQLIGQLSALVALGGSPAAAQRRPSTFEALGLNHLALRVTDLDRTQAFYEEHLGVTLIPSADPASLRLLACGPHVLNMFKASEARMDHVCFTVPNYDAKDAVRRLEAKNLKPDLQGDRTHFTDPDGYVLQVGGPNAGGQRR